MIILKLMSLIFIVHINAIPHRFVDEAEEEKPTQSFVRSSVEFIPSDDQTHSHLRVQGLGETEDVFDMKFSRAAVESIPRTVVSQYLPLRSAVEYNPGVEQFSHLRSRKERFLSIVIPSFRQSKAYDLEAYIAPHNPYDIDPYYYRIDSPYQQLIDPGTYEKLTQEKIKEENTNDDTNMNTRMMGELRRNDYKVVCHTTNWAFYRKDGGKFVPENLDYSLCTHIIYSFATLDPEQFIMLEFDPWADVENKLYSRTIKLAEDKPVLLAIGGWTDSTNGKYSKLVSDKQLSANFIDNVIPFLKRYGFAGLHFDWNYPACPQSDCKKGNTQDKDNFTRFIKELKRKLKQSSLMLTVAVSGYKEIITIGYDFKALSREVDFFTIMTYDYHGAWEKETGHVSPLTGSPNDKYPQYNTDFTIKLLLELGAERDKIVMGIPFYGQSFTLRSSSSRGYNSQAMGPGSPGEFTNQPGMLAYNEICALLRKSTYKKGTDPSGNSGPYITDGKIWAGFDDPEWVQKKAKYVVDNELGGISAWTVDLDDFNNNCCRETFPLLKAINRGLGRLNTVPPTRDDCKKPTYVTPPPVQMQTTVDSGQAGIPVTEEPSVTKSTTQSQWWTQSSTTTRRPAVQSSSSRPSYLSTGKPSQESPSVIPGPVNVMPVAVNGPCEPGQISPHPESCGHYLNCVQGEFFTQYCPTGLHWNADHKHCDWPATANCKVESKPANDEEVMEQPSSTTARTTSRSTTTRRTRSTRTTTTKAPSTTTSTATTTRRTTTTPARRTSPTTTRRPTRRTTARPTYYETTTSMTTTMPSTEAATTKKPIKKQTKCENGQYYSHKDCSRYYICTNNRRVPMFCPDGLQYSQKYKICDYEEKVKCVSRKKYQKLLEKQYRKTGIYTAALLRASAGDPCGQHQRYLKYPGKCGHYLECVHNQLIDRECAPGTFWNSAANSCDWNGDTDCKKDEEFEGEEEEEEEEEEEGEVSNELDTVEETNEANDVDGSVSNEFSSSSSSIRPPMVPQSPATTALETIPVKDQVEPLNGKYKLVLYFTNWAWYRPTEGKFLPEDIDPNLCTHIVYGFAVLNHDELTIKPHDSWADLDNRFYERVVEFKKKGIKVSLAIGGWNDSLGDKYSRLVRNPAARARFIKHVIEFLEKYGFDGLDLDWEYPVCWQVDCKKGYADEKQHFASFVRELSEAFKPRGLLLSAAVSPSKTVIDAGYDVPALAKYLDWIAVMCYDYHGQWDKKTGHVAPLYYHPDDDVDFFNTNYTINYWIQLGAPKHKIIMGMPTYGQSFTLADAKNHGLNAKAPGPGQAGLLTRAAGFLSYYEICDRILNQGWKVVRDPKGRLGPYAYKGNQWVSFDDQAMLKKKTQYIKDMDIGGGMIWALDLDDFRGKCNQGKYPLLKVIHQELQNEDGDHGDGNEIETPDEEEDPIDNEQPNERPSVEVVPLKPLDGNPDENEIEDEEDEEVIDEEDEEEEEDDETTEIEASDDEYKVVCYFTAWSWYRQGIGKFVPEDIDPDLCTHIVYGFAILNRDTLTIQPHDTWADIDNNFYKRITEFKKKGVKVSIAIGGWNDSAGDKYSLLVRSAAARARFIRHVIEFIEKHNFDGLDLDWEYPVCWQVDCTKGKPDEKESFSLLVKELSAAFKPKSFLLSSAVSPSKKVIDAGYDVEIISTFMDWVAVMCYDYHGQWDKRTGHVAPMYHHPESKEATFNTNFTINYWISKGADPKKLILGMPMYGQSFSLADRNNVGLNSASYGGGEAGDETRARGFLAYYEICTKIKKNNWSVVKDSRGTIGPYAYKGDQWVSFDDVHMIRHKSEYVKALGLGGAMIWALDLDDFKNTCDCEEYPLLRTINRVLRKYKGPHNNCLLENKKTYKPTAEPTTRKPTYTERPTTTKKPTYAEPTTKKPIYTERPTTKKPSRKTPSTTTSTATTTTEVAFEGEDYEEDNETEDEIIGAGKCNGGRAFIPHEKDCGKYYMCDHGTPVEYSCMHGLHWNPNHNICDWPQNVKCTLKDEGSDVGDEEEHEVEINENDVFEESSSTTKKPYQTTRRPTTTTVKTTTIQQRPTRPPIVSDPFVPTGNSKYMVVCYYTNWSWYRPGVGKYVPENIDPTLCTHVVFGFAVLNGETLVIRTHDSWSDIDNNFYTRVTALKKKGIKVSIAIGGWNDSLGDKYSRLVRSPEARARFIRNVMEFMRKYDFDGLDLDWEYPVCWQVDCTRGKPDEKQAFTAFVRELSEAFKPEGFLLSAAVSPSKKVIDAGYEIKEISKDMDWIAVMCYDYHGQWDKKTGHVAPLYVHPDDWEPTFNANFTINYWIEQGAPSRKLVLGMPTYGQSFSLENPSKNGLNEKAPGPGMQGEFTRSAGFLSFYEICHKINNGGWTVVKDPEHRMGPYAYKDRQWVSYDDVEQIRLKSKFVKDMNLGGAMIWALDLDDFRNRCGCGTYPLLSTINAELDRIETPRLSDCT